MLLIDLRSTSPWPGRRYVVAQGHEIDTVQDHELHARHATDRAWQAADDLRFLWRPRQTLVSFCSPILLDDRLAHR